MKTIIKRFGLPVLSIVVIAVLAVILVIQSRTWNSDRNQDQQRTEVLTVARSVVTSMTSLSTGESASTLSKFADQLAPTLRSQLLGPAGQLTALLSTAKVQSSGHILSAGIVSISSNNASVLVAADAQVTNASAPKGETRHYRMSVRLQREGGTWRASAIELVP